MCISCTTKYCELSFVLMNVKKKKNKKKNLKIRYRIYHIKRLYKVRTFVQRKTFLINYIYIIIHDTKYFTPFCVRITKHAPRETINTNKIQPTR